MNGARATLAIGVTQFKILRNDPWFLLIMFGMPIVIMPLMRQLMGQALVASGFDAASGAEFVVPGQMLLFSFFVAGTAGFSVYREHGWKTWDRLRSSAATPTAILAGFALPWIIIHMAYCGLLLIVGGLLFGLRLLDASTPAILLMLFTYASCVVALMLLATATFRTVNQLSGFQNVGGMIFAGLGGALVPIEQLPGWARFLSPATPTHWAMKGYRSIFLTEGGLTDVAQSGAVLLLAAAVLGLLASFRFKVDETKEFFA